MFQKPCPSGVLIATVSISAPPSPSHPLDGSCLLPLFLVTSISFSFFPPCLYILWLSKHKQLYNKHTSQDSLPNTDCQIKPKGTRDQGHYFSDQTLVKKIARAGQYLSNQGDVARQFCFLFFLSFRKSTAVATVF